MKELVIAHRGKHNKYFENTLNAFKEAAKLDFYGIETDIHLTKDNVWVVHHNNDFISDGKSYLIKDMKANDILKYHLDNEQNDKDAYIPLLSDYLKVCKESGKRPIIEIKPKFVGYSKLKKLVKYVDRKFSLENVTFIAFYPWPLIFLRMIGKKRIHLQQLIFDHFELIKLAKVLKMDIDIEIDHLDEKKVAYMHNHGLKVNVWTVDNKEQLEKAHNLNVDYVTTNEFTQKSN